METNPNIEPKVEVYESDDGVLDVIFVPHSETAAAGDRERDRGAAAVTLASCALARALLA